MPTKRPRGRPTKYSDKIAKRICDQLAEGKPLVVICADPSMPCTSTVRLWQQQRPEFSAVILDARDAGADALAGQVLVIAENRNGDVGRDRLRIAARMWLASKLAPKRWGDKVEVTHHVTPLFSTAELIARYRARTGQADNDDEAADDDDARHAV
jgi:hypothetical protein